MAESSLTAGRTELLRAVAMVAGWDRDPGNWPSDQTTAGDDFVNAALRKFYKSYDWSFLHIITTIATVADDFDQTLPDDFGKIESEFTYAAEQGYGPIIERNESWIRTQKQYSDDSDRPYYYAIRARDSDQTTGQRWEVLWYPKPAAAYTLTYQYWAHPDKISSSAPYPFGGMIHSETVKAFTEAEVELQLLNERGVFAANAQDLLAKSIAWDQQNASPKTLGYVGNDEEGSIEAVRWPNYSRGTYNDSYSS